MSLPNDLLEQAKMLHALDPRRPKQASLRRAISAAYYALFHLLIEEATTMMFGGQLDRKRFRDVLGRGFSHSSMNAACKSFGVGALPTALSNILGLLVIPTDLQTVGSVFVQLQQMRHQADYNMARRFSKSEVLVLVQDAEEAFLAWQKVRNDEAARFFLMSLPLWEQIKRA